jgi:hypothetical protein
MYRVLFDVSAAHSWLIFYLLGLVLPPCILALAIFFFRDAGPKPGPKPTFFVIWAVMLTLMAWLLCGTGIWDYYSARRALRTGDFSVAEGVVENFVQGGDHKVESFTVSGKPFSYGCCGGESETFTSDYNPGGRHIHNGARVRIAYRGDTILKVEVE